MPCSPDILAETIRYTRRSRKWLPCYGFGLGTSRGFLPRDKRIPPGIAHEVFEAGWGDVPGIPRSAVRLEGALEPVESGVVIIKVHGQFDDRVLAYVFSPSPLDESIAQAANLVVTIQTA